MVEEAKGKNRLIQDVISGMKVHDEFSILYEIWYKKPVTYNSINRGHSAF